MAVDLSRLGLHCPLQMPSIPRHSLAAGARTDTEPDDQIQNRAVSSPEHCVGYNIPAEHMSAVLQWYTCYLYVLLLSLSQPNAQIFSLNIP